ncbi:MAG TPA: S-layer homology domain-containing protein [Symbiobacteriaceae bacterium]|nr:S-layer homology domain-containing protein [Symbiobacteriaceae bacterium]
MEGKHWRLAALVAVLLPLIVAKPAAGILTDMAAHWAGPLVGALEARGIVSGDEDLRFHPETPLTRAELAKLVVSGLGHGDEARLLGDYSSRFEDIPNWHWAKGYIESLSEIGAVEGYPDGRFGPGDEVSRAQLAVILVRIAGLGEQARLMRFEHTPFFDDREIPDWARGYVHVAQTAGLIAGFEDNTFRPLLPVTRAEGATTLFRLLATKGSVFHLSGTLVRFDQGTYQGVVRDSAGTETAFTMSPTAQYYRAGLPSHAGRVRPMDQVWIILGPDGIGSYMDARFADRLVTNLHVTARTVTGTLSGGGTRTAEVSPGALVYLDGRPASLSQLDGVAMAYLIFDRVTGEVRVLDGLNVSVSGRFVGLDTVPAAIAVEIDQDLKSLLLAADAIFVLNGQPVDRVELQEGDSLQLVLDQSGAATYVLAER